jgi:hypothetical protein
VLRPSDLGPGRLIIVSAGLGPFVEVQHAQSCAPSFYVPAQTQQMLPILVQAHASFTARQSTLTAPGRLQHSPRCRKVCCAVHNRSFTVTPALLLHPLQVGDVHGCYDQLVELLQKVQYKPRHDNLILVGDLVNKGPKSQQVSSTLCATNTGAAPTTQHEAGRMCYPTVFMGSQHQQQRSWSSGVTRCSAARSV